MSDLELVITRGLPASGKSTRAREWCAEKRPRVRVNRDDLRLNMFNIDRTERLDFQQEQDVSLAQKAAVEALLRGGVSVIVDDTHLKLKHARAWADLARETGARFSTIDIRTDFDTCVKRDKARGAPVGEARIRAMNERFHWWWKHDVTPNEDPERPTVTPWEPDPSLPPAYIVDIDGTLAKKRKGPGERGWHDYARVGEDLPYQRNLDLVMALRTTAVNGLRPAILLVSGRDQSCEDETRDWLWGRLFGGADMLLMRPAGDQRKDTTIKAELFDAHIRGRYNVLGVLDDRPSVCRMWRAMGLDVLAVGDPHTEF